MQILSTVLLVIQIITAVIMVGLILLQHGKGADLGASFGSGASGSLFGASGAANALSRATAISAALFFSMTLALAYLGQYKVTSEGELKLREQLAAPVAPQPAASIPISGNTTQAPSNNLAAPSNNLAVPKAASIPASPVSNPKQ